MTKTVLVTALVVIAAAYAHNSRVESFNSCFNVLMEVRGIKYPTTADRYEATFVCGKPGIFESSN